MSESLRVRSLLRAGVSRDDVQCGLGILLVTVRVSNNFGLADLGLWERNVVDGIGAPARSETRDEILCVLSLLHWPRLICYSCYPDHVNM